MPANKLSRRHGPPEPGALRPALVVAGCRASHVEPTNPSTHTHPPIHPGKQWLFECIPFILVLHVALAFRVLSQRLFVVFRFSLQWLISNFCGILFLLPSMFVSHVCLRFFFPFWGFSFVPPFFFLCRLAIFFVFQLHACVPIRWLFLVMLLFLVCVFLMFLFLALFSFLELYVCLVFFDPSCLFTPRFFVEAPFFSWLVVFS